MLSEGDREEKRSGFYVLTEIPALWYILEALKTGKFYSDISTENQNF